MGGLRDAGTQRLLRPRSVREGGRKRDHGRKRVGWDV